MLTKPAFRPPHGRGRHSASAGRHSASAYHQSGSAYLITLLSLVVLTMLALSLTFTTQTELLVGTNERTIQRAFYGAESGVHMAAARTLRSHDKCLYGAEFDDIPTGKPGSLLKAWVEYDYIYPVAAPFCNLCDAKDADEYSSKAFFKVNHVIQGESRIFLGCETGARKRITDMIDVQPWQDSLPPAPETCGKQRLSTATDLINRSSSGSCGDDNTRATEMLQATSDLFSPSI